VGRRVLFSDFVGCLGGFTRPAFDD